MNGNAYICSECRLPLATADDAIEHQKKTSHPFMRIKHEEEK